MTIRMTGGVSGMDIDSMVKQLMQAERAPLDKLKQKKQLLQWQRDDYRDMNSTLLSLKDASFKMKLQSTYLTKKATSTDETILSATGTANAVDGTYKINITQLAKTAELTSSSAIGAKDATKKLSELGLTGDTQITISGEKGSTTIGVSANDSLGLLVSKINAQTSLTGTRVSYDAAFDKMFFTSANTGAQTKINLSESGANLLDILKLNKAGSSYTGDRQFTVTTRNAAGNDVTTISSSAVIDNTLTADQTLKISYGGVNSQFTIKSSTTIRDLMDQINNSDLGKLGINSFLDANGKLNFTTPDGTALNFSDETADGSDIISKLGMTAPTVKTNSIASGSVGKDAMVTYNDNSTASFSTNVFTVNGMSIRALKLGQANVTVTQDTDAAFNSIKDFIDKYNEVIDKVNKKISEQVNGDYKPLSDEQRQNLSDDQIKKWEEQARLGDIKGDSILSRVLSEMRTDLNNSVKGLATGDISQLAQIGITTGAYNEKGKLYISNEAKLREALASKPEQVMRLFNSSDDASTATANSRDGLAVRLYNRLNDAMKQITDKAGSAAAISDTSLIAKDLKDVNKRIKDMDNKMKDKEDRYYKKFAAMETAMNKFNAQSNSLASFMAKN